MDNKNVKQNNMNDSNIPFVSHFSILREHPKWIVKSIIIIVLAIINAIISFITSKGLLASQPQANSEINTNTFRISTSIGGFFGTIFSVSLCS